MTAQRVRVSIGSSQSPQGIPPAATGAVGEGYRPRALHLSALESLGGSGKAGSRPCSGLQGPRAPDPIGPGRTGVMPFPRAPGSRTCRTGVVPLPRVPRPLTRESVLQHVPRATLMLLTRDPTLKTAANLDDPT